MPTLKDETRGRIHSTREIEPFRPSRDRGFDETRDRVEILAEMATAISAIAPSDEVIDRAVERLARSFPSHRVTYGTIDAGGTTRVVHSARPADPPHPGTKGQFALGPEYVRELRRGERIIVHDIFVDSRTATLADALDRSETRSFVAVPLQHSSALAGFFAFSSSEPRVWSRHEIDTLTGVARFAALAITTANERYERLRVENALRQSEQRYRDLVDCSQALICSHDLDGRITSINPAAAHTLGYEPGELAGCDLADILAPSIRGRMPEYLARIRQAGSDAGATEVVTRTGEERIWTYRSVRRDDSQNPTVLAHGRDITASRRAQERERALEAIMGAPAISQESDQSPSPVAQELKTLISTIRRNAELALVNTPSDATTKRHVEAIEKAALEAAELTHRVPRRNTSRSVAVAPTTVSPSLPESLLRDRTWMASGTVLVVDDEPAVRSLLRAALERHGFEVLSAAEGSSGVATFEEHCAEIRAVLLDLTMPGMGGAEAFAAIHRISPETPVILVSGYADRDTVQRFMQAGVAAFLRKPFQPSVLLDTLRNALDNHAKPGSSLDSGISGSSALNASP